MKTAQRMRHSVGRWVLFALAWLACGTIATGADGAGSPEGVAFFESKVRPILVEHCAQCHGEAKQKGGLRLDSRVAILEGGDSGPSIVPGEPDKSPLVLAVRHEGDVHMPPKKKLDDPSIEALGQWVRMGAPWPDGAVVPEKARADAAKQHWSFQPVRDPAPPAVKSASATIANPVDAFLVAALEAKGLAPSASASKRALIRRATYDLHGLPPSLDEVDAFLADSSPDAFAKLVDRLLASPRYGERWGRHWLDVARYADTKGYVFQEERRYPFSYTYRDYVIRAFNEDRPYDRFILEQLAADKLDLGDDNRALAGLGFLTVGRRFLKANDDIIDDRIDVVTRGFLGLGVACARCHDHKFDPIPTEDYYSLHGVFASSVEPDDLPTMHPIETNPDTPAYEQERAARQKVADDDLDRLRAAIDTEIRGNLARFVPAAFDLDFQPRSPKLDETARAAGLSPERLRWASPRIGKILNKEGDEPILAAWRAFAAIPPAEFAARAAEVREHLVPDAPAVLKAFADGPPPATLREVAVRYGALFERAAKTGPVDPEFIGPPEMAPDPTLDDIRALLASGDGALAVPADQARRVLNRAEREAHDRLVKKVGELDVTHPGSPARAMVLVDAPKPVEPHVYIRGNPGRPGKTIPRRFLRVLSEGGEAEPFTDGSGRLGLARAIANPTNPLTARVMVNRIWMHHFGAGLVLTPSDYGARGELPSNPDLLDYLATRFIASGWSIKAMHRLMMNSAAYQQNSDHRPDGEAIDPSNRLVWRQERRRLDFEAMRDGLLAASGQLDPAMGGRPVALFVGEDWARKRTIYGYVDRLDLDAAFPTFDFANPDAHAPTRPQTTVPQQALFFMNSPFLLDQAKALAHRPDIEALPDVDAKIARLYLSLFGRPAEPREVELGRRFVLSRPEADQAKGMSPLGRVCPGAVAHQRIHVHRLIPEVAADVPPPRPDPATPS